MLVIACCHFFPEYLCKHGCKNALCMQIRVLFYGSLRHHLSCPVFSFSTSIFISWQRLSRDKHLLWEMTCVINGQSNSFLVFVVGSLRALDVTHFTFFLINLLSSSRHLCWSSWKLVPHSLYKALLSTLFLFSCCTCLAIHTTSLAKGSV